MKKIKEVFSITSGFFTQLKADNPETYKALFENFEPSDLEIDFLSICGERYAAPVVTYSNDMATLTRVILNRYNEAWAKVKAALFADYDITSPYNMETTTTNESEVKTANETENTNAAAVYGFDSETAVNDKTATDTGASNGTRTEQTQRITRRKGNIGNSTFPELINAEIETRKITFLTLVMNDIKEFVTLKIY